MIRTVRYTAVILTLVLLMAGCSAKEPVTYPMETDIYTPALTQLASSDQVSMTVTIEKTLSVAGEALKETHNQQLLYTAPASDSPMIHVTGSTEYANHQIQTEEYFADGTLYLTVDGSKFRGSIAKEDYLAQLVPVQMLDPQLYSQILVSETEDMTELHFSEPTAAEQWAIPEGGMLTSALGTASLDPGRNLLSAMYEISYTLDQADITLRVHAHYSTPEDQRFEAPNPEEYISLQDIQGPLMAEKAYGYLLQSRYMDAELTESIFSEANSLYYDQTIQISRSTEGADMETNASLTDASRGGEVSQFRQLESFHDGVYTITTNDGKPEEQPRITSQDMNTYCTNLLTENILAPRHITDCTAVTDGQLLTVTYTAGEALAELICQESCQTIYQDSGFLDSQTDFYEEYAVSFILTVDRITGLPVSSALEFHGIHHIDGINYQLVTNYRQLYTFTAE